MQYPQSAVFVKSAKGDNGKWNGKWYNDVMAFKVENRNYENLVNKEIAEAADAPVSNDDDLGLPF